MQSINISAYYEQISNLRAKIINKHRQQPAQAVHKYLGQDTLKTVPVQNASQPLLEPLQNHSTPLQQVSSSQQNISERLKELDSVNDKIKLILASQRYPLSKTSKKHNPVSLQYTQLPKKLNLETPVRRITSLFECQQKILVSKVAPLSRNLPKNNEDISQERAFKTNPVNNTVQSRLMNNEIKQNFILGQSCKLRQTNLYNFQSLRQQTSQDTVKQTHFQLNTFRKRKDSTLQNKNNNSLLPEQNSLIHGQEKFAAQIKSFNLNDISSKKQSQKLFDLLISQIALENKLRESKQDFAFHKVQNKWKKLKEQIGNYALYISDQELQNWITLWPEESDPFNQRLAEPNFSQRQLAARFVCAWNHWHKNLKCALKINKLQEERFKVEKMDLGEKGYIAIQDLVSSINLHTNSCFRNRDIYCLFKRLSAQSKGQKVQKGLKYQAFLSFFAQ